jgi:competence protein ComEC
MSEVIILDVAHGNCSLLNSRGLYCVIDAPIGALLLNTLEDMGISCIDVAFISHADKDHIAGIIGLLSSATIQLKKLYLNPDSQKRTKIWRDLRAAVSVAERQGTCEVITTLTTTTPGTETIGDVAIQVEAPSNSFILAGAGSKDNQGRPITSNSISALLRLKHSDNAGILLAGDIDDVGLDDALNSGRDLTAHTLVFPHHGGLPDASNIAAFVDRIMSAVHPSLVIFSNGREKHDNPRLEVVSPVIQTGCGIACTQLAKSCSKSPTSARSHLEPHRAHGKPTGASCAGSITIDLANGGRRLTSIELAHQKFIDDVVETPMCRVLPVGQ